MSIGIWQIVLILAIVLILFGAGKIPRVMGDVAKGIKNFKSGMKEEASKDEDKEIEKEETVSVKKDKAAEETKPK
ncbi:MAG: Sec-independent protein translocase protein TatA [Alphaproteobacteria bacterium MarineAlpha9_Bin2]|nr:MAG: Sec-independent protein translocase protein TatA [Alphaproteobacteria bacterium MarineAlpha9_Bin2]PPR29319.1 MAG: Sec-independent protein translocase protein TatA [Alphaproteobacteria bacterium MarineAlpha9_Bin1]